MILLIYLFTGEFRLETHGPLGTMWVSLGLIAFYLALIWLNTLLGFFLTPLFMVPGTWLLDWRIYGQIVNAVYGVMPDAPGSAEDA